MNNLKEIRERMKTASDGIWADYVRLLGVLLYCARREEKAGGLRVVRKIDQSADATLYDPVRDRYVNIHLNVYDMGFEGTFVK